MSLGEMRFFVRARLWRHLFFWFGMTILASVTTTSVIGMIMHRMTSEPNHHRFGEALQYVAYDVGQAWGDPDALHVLLQAAQKEYGSDFMLQDHNHRVIDSVGVCHASPPPGPDSFFREVERATPGAGRPLLPNLLGQHAPPPFFMGDHLSMVVQHDKPVGWLVMCSMPIPPMPSTWRLALPFVVLMLMLGAATYRVAQGLTQPLANLVHVTKRIGAGHLESRVALEKRPPGEVGELALSINEMATKIEKQMSDQRTLLAMVSHELRTPLARMRLLVELAQDAGQTSRSLEEIETEVISIDNIVGTLLANARLEFAIVSRQASDAAILLRRAVVDCMPAPPLDIPAKESWNLSGDITLLTRALANLVDNARKYGRGVASGRLRRQGEHIRFEIIDRGNGFTEDTKKVFEPFVRSADAETLDPTSMGLGLSLVKRVAEAHDGTAWCENLSGGGACVGFSVKVVPAPQKGTPTPNSNTGNGPNA